jgi:hypothetical protein
MLANCIDIKLIDHQIDTYGEYVQMAAFFFFDNFPNSVYQMTYFFGFSLSEKIVLCLDYFFFIYLKIPDRICINIKCIYSIPSLKRNNPRELEFEPIPQRWRPHFQLESEKVSSRGKGSRPLKTLTNYRRSSSECR